MRVLHEAIGQLADMHKSILVDADVDEGAKRRNVGDRAFKLHAGLEVLERLDPVGEGCGLEAGPRIATRLFKFGENILHGGQAETLTDEILRRQGPQLGGVAHQAADVAATGLDDPANDTIGFRVDRRGIERLLAVADPQEARRLLEGLRAEAGDFQQFLA